jgi:hypothetical protein
MNARLAKQPVDLGFPNIRSSVNRQIPYPQRAPWSFCPATLTASMGSEGRLLHLEQPRRVFGYTFHCLLPILIPIHEAAKRFVQQCVTLPQPYRLPSIPHSRGSASRLSY